MQKLIELCVEGAKVIDLCIEGDKLIEQTVATVYNKPVKGVKVTKGMYPFLRPRAPAMNFCTFNRYRVPYVCLRQQRRRALFSARVSTWSIQLIIFS